MSKLYKNIAVTLTALTLIATPLQAVEALSVNGNSGTTSGASGGNTLDLQSSSDAYANKWYPSSGSTSSNRLNLNGNSGGTSTARSNQMDLGGGTGTSSNRMNLGGSTGGTSTGSNYISVSGGNYGSSRVPGGYQYNPYNKMNLGGASGQTGSNYISLGGSSSRGSNQMNLGGGARTGGPTGSNYISIGGGNYGSSSVPGGYQYNPDSNKLNLGGTNNSGNATGSNYVNVGGGARTGGPTGSNYISIGGGNYGNSSVPGGYQYDPDSNKLDLNGNSATRPDNKVDVGTAATEKPDNKIALGSSEEKPDNKIDLNEEEDDLTPGYYYCMEMNSNDSVFVKTTKDGSEWTMSFYDENGNLYSTRTTTATLYENWTPDETYQDVRDCEQISKDLFNLYVDRADDNDDDDDDDNDDDDDDDDDDRVSLCDGKPYPRDIDGHWSEIYVRRLYDLCVVEGYEDGNFRPNADVTRAELVKMGLFANGIEPNHGCYDNDCGSPYRDLDEWQGKWVRVAHDKGIVEGYVYDQFRPNQAITRAEAVKIVLATYGYTPTNDTESFFNDVDGWSVGWVERARLIGLVQGIGNGNFDPNRPITRAEAAKIVAKMIEYWDTSVREDNKNR